MNSLVQRLRLNRDILLLIPTHSHPLCLPLAIASAQRQSVSDIDIVVIGDGVGDDTRAVMSPILASDERVQFVDLPKGVRHGEEYRDAIIRHSDASVITYLGDDDLFFPHHIETMIGCLAGVDFANPLPILIVKGGVLHYMATDLADPASVAWHLDRSVYRNSVSLTGVIHTRQSYLRLPHGWRPAPAGRWTDHYMWEQYFQLDGFIGRTSALATTAKFMQSVRNDMTDEARADEIRTFASCMAEPGFNAQWNDQVTECVRRSSVASLLRIAELEARFRLG